MESNDTGYCAIVDPAANDRMHEHFEFLGRVRESASERLLDSLVKDIGSLESKPYRNPVYDRPYLPRGKYRYMLSGDRYRIVYQVEGSFVYVDDIQDCRQSDSRSLLF